MNNNNDLLKRMLYLVEYSNKNDFSNKKIIKENIDLLLETKEAEMQALKLLTDSGIIEIDSNNLIKKFKEIDKTKNKSLIAVIAKAYLELGNSSIGNISILMNSVAEMVNSSKIPAPIVNDRGYVIKDKIFPDYIKFSEYIHGIEGMSKGYGEHKGKMEVADEDNYPIEINGKTEWDGISVYDGNHVGKCIKYTMGGLTGQAYSFCIGQPTQGNMWQSYRDTKTSTFYYVIDRTKDLNDPLHIVVVDHTEYGFELTDSNNTTGNISEFDDDADAYLDYLRDRGVPVDEIFLHKPKTEEEKIEQQKLGTKVLDLKWFKDLSYDEKSKYIGRGHLLSDEQFKYLWQFLNDKGGYKLLHQYLDTGQPIPENQFNILISDSQ